MNLGFSTGATGKTCWNVTHPLTLFDMGFFEPSVMRGIRAPHHNFVVNAPMIMKFGKGVKLDAFYTMVGKSL